MLKASNLCTFSQINPVLRSANLCVGEVISVKLHLGQSFFNVVKVVEMAETIGLGSALRSRNYFFISGRVLTSVSGE